VTEPPLTDGERRLVALMRVFAVLFAAGAILFFLRPYGTVADLDRVGVALGLAPLPAAGGPVAADFWLILAVANMATIAACAGLIARDVRRHRALAYPLVVSKITSSTAGLLLFVVRAPAMPFLAATLVDLPIALLTIAALRGAPPPRGSGPGH
jgi:hypothetical protein